MKDKGKPGRSWLTCIPRVSMGDNPVRKAKVAYNSPWTTFLTGKEEGEVGLSGGEWVIFENSEWALRGTDGRYDSLWQSLSRCFVGLSAPPVIRLSLLWLMKLLSGRRIYASWVPFGGSAFRQVRGFQWKLLQSIYYFSSPCHSK